MTLQSALHKLVKRADKEFTARYPFNNFLHHHAENIIVSCLENTHEQGQLIVHVLDECKLLTRILEAEKNSALSIDLTKVQNSLLLLISYSQPADGSTTFPTEIFTYYSPCSIHYLRREELHQGLDLLVILHA